jgi:hypothetical protein
MIKDNDGKAMLLVTFFTTGVDPAIAKAVF